MGDWSVLSPDALSAHEQARGIERCDTVISGLPWAIFPAALQMSILEEVNMSLKPGGRFCTFAYLQGLLMPAGQRFRSLLEKTFKNVERSPIVWKNLPPAFVYRCEKKTVAEDEQATDPLVCAEKDNARLTADVQRLEAENESLADVLVTDKIGMQQRMPKERKWD